METAWGPGGSNAPALSQVGAAATALVQALNARDADAAALALSDLNSKLPNEYTLEGPAETVTLAWAASAHALDAPLRPEACTDALQALAALAQFCPQCSTVPVGEWCTVMPAEVGLRVGGCMQRYADDAGVQAAGCTLMARLAGCASCRCSHSPALSDSLGSAGSIGAVLAALGRLRHSKTVPRAAVSQALAMLRFLALSEPANLERLAAAGGMVALLDAIPADTQAEADFIMLLAALACRATAQPSETEAALGLVWRAAKRQADSQAVPELEVARAGAWAMARIAHHSLSKSVLSGHGLAAVVLQQGVPIVLTFLQRFGGIDPTLVKNCLDYAAVVAAAHSSPAAQPAAQALCSPDLIAAVAAFAALGSEQRMQSSALRTLFYLSRCSPDFVPSVAPAVLASMAAARANSHSKNNGEVLGIQAHGLGCLAALQQPVRVEDCQAALTTACTLLADPALQPLLVDSHLAPPELGCHSGTTRQQEPVAWIALEAGVRATASALSQAHPAGVNATDGQGFTLLHRLAAAGLDRGVALLLDPAAGHEVDVLLRTRGGANALQLAREGGHAACAALLGQITLEAAEARQAALLAELDEAEGGCSSGGARIKGRKKKSCTSSSSFVAEQPELKSPRLDGGAEAAAAEAAALSKASSEAAAQREYDRRRSLDAKYERALDERRRELAAQQLAADQAAVAEVRALAAAAQGAREAVVAAGSVSQGAQLDSLTPPDHRPSTPSRDGLGHQDDCARAEESSGSATRCSSDSGSGSGSDAAARECSAAAPPGLPSTFVPSLMCGLGGAVGSQGPNTQHSLFGSPSLTGDVFGRTVTSASLFPIHMAPSSQNVSPLPGSTTLLGLPPLPQSAPPVQQADRPLSSRLQDALFVQDDLLPSQAAAQHASLQRQAAQFASLRGSGGGGTSSGASSLFDRQPGGGGLDGQRGSSGSGGGSSQGTSSPRSSCTAPSHRSGGGSMVHGYNSGWGADSDAADALFASLSDLRHCSARPGSDSSDGAMHPTLADSSDECSGPTRHLWIGNLATRTPRTALKALFERYGCVDDVVTFPGRMYAFVNYRTTEEATRAREALQDQVVSEVTGERRLLLKYRPAKKAAAHLRAAGMGEDGNGYYEGDRDEGGRVFEVDRDGNCSEPSPRIWLGNMAPTASSKVLQAVLSRFGPLVDAAVFPARIGPLGYAFVKFESVEDAIAAFEALNNTVVPPLSGTKQLKMRYKPAGDGPGARDEGNDATKAATAPSRHIWLGNVTQKPTEELILDMFGRYGQVDSVRIFPAKAYAFVNYAEMGAAARAMAELDGLPVAPLTGVKPLVMRYQQESHPAVKGPMQRVQSDSALALAASLGQAARGGGASSLSQLAHYGQKDAALGAPPGGLGNKLNPNNAAYDSSVAGHYRQLSRHERDAVWAADAPLEAGPVRLTPHAMHRSQSMGLLGAHPPPGLAGAAARSAAPASPAASYAPMLGLQQQQQQQQHAQGASATKLSALLNNLAALQQAASLPPGPSSHPSLQQQLLQLSMLQPQHGPPATQDIARLSSMLAAQSLIAPANPPPPLPAFHVSSSPQAAAAPTMGSSYPPHQYLLCPLSGGLMVDAVVAADGVTYNRDAITEWMAARTSSPVTHAKLPHTFLTPNDAVQSAVLQYLRSQMGV